MDIRTEIVPFRAAALRRNPDRQDQSYQLPQPGPEQFDMNVQSIDHVGLLKPIRVNDKFVERTGHVRVDLRRRTLLAHQRLGKETILAEVVTCTRKEAYLQSLIENIARTKPGSMDFARELKRLHDEGWDYAQIARVACKTENYIKDYIRLVEQGEERLIHGVEQGVFPISFAMLVAAADDRPDPARAHGRLRRGTRHHEQLRPGPADHHGPRPESKERQKPRREYTVDQLKQDIAEATQGQDLLCPRGQEQGEPLPDPVERDQRPLAGRELVQLLREEKTRRPPATGGRFCLRTP